MSKHSHYSLQMSTVVNTLIGLSLMFFGRFLPPLSLTANYSEKLVNLGFPVIDGNVLVSISPMGMAVFTIFIGTVYLWATVNTVWPGFLAILLLGFSEHFAMNDVLIRFMGNPTVVLAFFLFHFSAILVRSQIAVYLARWLMTRPIATGRPWVFILLFLSATYFVAFLDQVATLFIMWPVLYYVCNKLGLKKGDQIVSLLLVNSTALVLCNYAMDAVKGGSFFLITNLYSLAGNNPSLQLQPMEYGSFMIWGILVSLVMLAVLMFFMRFVFRVDVSKLKNINPDMFAEEELPPMNWKQKSLIVIFILYTLWMLAPGFLPKDAALTLFLRDNIFSGTLILIFLVSFISYKGEPIADITITNSSFPFQAYLFTAVCFALGHFLTLQPTNVSLFLETLTSKLLDGLDFYAFTIGIMCIAIVVTNFSNSIVIGLILSPVAVTLSNSYGFPPEPVLACLFFAVFFGCVTPAASSFAAILFGSTEWIDTPTVFKYTTINSVLMIIVMTLVGLPLATLFF